jgi:hypothetical protein
VSAIGGDSIDMSGCLPMSDRVRGAVVGALVAILGPLIGTALLISPFLLAVSVEMAVHAPLIKDTRPAEIVAADRELGNVIQYATAALAYLYGSIPASAVGFWAGRRVWRGQRIDAERAVSVGVFAGLLQFVPIVLALLLCVSWGEYKVGKGFGGLLIPLPIVFVASLVAPRACLALLRFARLIPAEVAPRKSRVVLLLIWAGFVAYLAYGGVPRLPSDMSVSDPANVEALRVATTRHAILYGLLAVGPPAIALIFARFFRRG